MKKILIIAPHYPPSNLAAVHRSRLFAQHLPSFGWKPVILTVHERYYEERLDWNLHQLLPIEQQIEKVKALPVTKPRLIGDLGLRAFFQLRKRALDLVRKQNIDFVYIPIPSFYVSLIGPYLHRKTGVKYGIDYIDPWVHQFPGSERMFSRHWWSTKLSCFLEPIAVKNASLITGVAEGYYHGVIQRNPQLQKNCLFGAMPYGGEKEDHEKVKYLQTKPYLFKRKEGTTLLVYAGAMLPKAYRPIEEIFKAIDRDRTLYKNVEIHFIGTGKSPADEKSYAIRPLAEKYNLWQSVIFEYPARIPYLDVLIHLEASSGIFILGSTEPHYTPSKVYQAVLCKKPLLAVLHEKSSAFGILAKLTTASTIGINEASINELHLNFPKAFVAFLQCQKFLTEDRTSFPELDMYSAKEVTRKLSLLLNSLVDS